MKKSFMILAVLAMSALAMVSCKKDNENPIDDGTFGGGATEYPGLCFTAEKDTSSVSMNNCNLGRNFEYLIPGEDWTTFTPGSTTITLLKKGDKVYFRGDNANGLNDDNDNYYFVMTGEIAASGNIMSLIDTTCSATAIPNDCCFSNLFDGCTSLTSAPELPATTLTANCYRLMFYGCTSLTSAPELPATSLATGCYGFMFGGCTSLKEIKVNFTDWKIIENSISFSLLGTECSLPMPEYTALWVHGVPGGGTFRCPAALPQVYSQQLCQVSVIIEETYTYLMSSFLGSAIPDGWTVETF